MKEFIVNQISKLMTTKELESQLEFHKLQGYELAFITETFAIYRLQKGGSGGKRKAAKKDVEIHK